MLFNNAISASIGLVPVVGDVALAIWKANSRNAWLLEEFLTIRGDELLKVRSLSIWFASPSLCWLVRVASYPDPSLVPCALTPLLAPRTLYRECA